jgi:hypothetical protein
VVPGIVTVMGNYTRAAGAALTENFGNYSTLHVKWCRPRSRAAPVCQLQSLCSGLGDGGPATHGIALRYS